MRPTIDNVRAITNFATAYRWNLFFATLPAAGNFDIGIQDLNLRCESSSIPKMTSTETVVQIRGHKVNQPGIYEYENPLTLTFFETEDNVVSAFIKKWRDLCWEPKTGRQYPKLDLECVILLQRLDSNDNPIWEYTLTGCFLMNYTPGNELVGEGSEALKPTMEISYDYFEDQAV